MDSCGYIVNPSSRMPHDSLLQSANADAHLYEHDHTIIYTHIHSDRNKHVDKHPNSRTLAYAVSNRYSDPTESDFRPDQSKVRQ